MATSISITSNEIESLHSVIDYVETNLEAGDEDNSTREDIKKLYNIVKKYNKSNLRTICKNTLKKIGKDTKENIDDMIIEMEKQGFGK